MSPLYWLFVIFAPPLAVLLCRRPIAAIINIPLCMLGWVPGTAHAAYVVSRHTMREEWNDIDDPDVEEPN